MKKENYGVYIAVVVFLIVLGIGLYFNGKGTSIPSPLNTGSTATPTLPVVTPPPSDTNTQDPQSEQALMQHQSDCSNWGNIILQNNSATTYADHTITTHYNSSLAKCFVEIDANAYFTNSNSSEKDVQVYDAAKGLHVLSSQEFIDPNSVTDYYWEYTNPQDPIGNSLTAKQFVDLQEQYMNN